MTDTDAGQRKESSPSSLIIRLDLNHTLACESNSDKEGRNKQIDEAYQPKTNKEITPGLDDLVLRELEELGRACRSKHMQPSMSTIRVNLEDLAGRVQRTEFPLANANSRPRASSSTSN